MNEVEAKTETQKQGKWHINLDWFQQRNRSFTSLAHGLLCAKCRKRHKKELSATELVALITSCCASDPNFINGQLPVMESVFRFFLSSGNKPLDVNELSKEVNARRGDAYRVSPETLARLLKNDDYYGLHETSD